MEEKRFNMRELKGKSLQEILGKLKPKQKEIVEKLRSLTKATLPNVVETIKWGNITYHLGENNLSWILIYSDHVDYGFFRGAELYSPYLEGTGKGLRHIRINDDKSLDEKEIMRLLQEAAKLS
jgi:hypothetical protein